MTPRPNAQPTALITGCSPGGIGHALALALHHRSYRVFATARNTDTLSTLTSLGITAIPLEVNSSASIQSCLATIQTQTHGHGLDMLINNAGVNYTVPALDVDMAEARAVFDTNVFAVMHLTQVFAPLLISAQGTIVMVGSLAGLMPYVFGSVYNASKAALHAYANTLRVEMAPLGVKVVIVMTGGVKSQLTTRVKRVLPVGSWYEALEVEYQVRQAHSRTVGMETEMYAESVVRQILPGGGSWVWPTGWFGGDVRSRWVWEGYGWERVYAFAGGWLWNGLFDWYFTRLFGLNKIRGEVERKRKQN